LNLEIDKLLFVSGRCNVLLLRDVTVGKKIEKVIKLVNDEWCETKSENNETIYFLMQTLFSMILRNVHYHLKMEDNSRTEKTTLILNYLHENIYDPDRTDLMHLAEKFNYSKHYLGTYFREQVGVTLRDYVNRYKLHLIENRLLYSSKSLKEISNLFGFTDLSHFNKFFRKHKNVNPSRFRIERSKRAH
jgi:AraC-like DNA-binding protein